MYVTKTNEYWKTQPGKIDTLNLKEIFPSRSPYGIPELHPSSLVEPANLAAWHVARQREYAAKTGGAIHFFLDDYRFETAWSSPARSLSRVKAVGAALTPDFSLWRSMPLAAQVWNTYRSRWCGAYWQANGVEVIPTACWAGEQTYSFCFDGIPVGGPVAISTVGIRGEAEDQGLFKAGVEALLAITKPSLLLVYGRLKYCDNLTLPEIREYPTFWDRRKAGE